LRLRGGPQDVQVPDCDPSGLGLQGPDRWSRLQFRALAKGFKASRLFGREGGVEAMREVALVV
jgi:hypothetical protein